MWLFFWRFWFKKKSYDSHPKHLQKKAQNCWNPFVNYKTTYSRTLKMVPSKSRNEIKEKDRNFNQKLTPQPTLSRSNNNHTSNEPITAHSTRRWWWNDSRWVKLSIHRLLLSFVIWSDDHLCCCYSCQNQLHLIPHHQHKKHNHTMAKQLKHPIQPRCYEHILGRIHNNSFNCARRSSNILRDLFGIIKQMLIASNFLWSRMISFWLTSDENRM